MHRYSPGRFEMYKADSGALRFKIRHSGAHGQGMLSLISKSRPQKVLYDIIVGPVFIVMTIRTGPNHRDIRCPLPGPIGTEFTEFWITWYGCVLRLGIGSDPEPVLTYRDGFSVEYNIGFIQFNMRPSNIHPIPVEWNFEASPVVLRAPKEKIFDDDLQWKGMIIEERNGNMVQLLPNGAMIGGYENEPIYIARTELFGSLCIGKYVPSKCSAFFPWGENEHEVQSCEILCGMNAKWVKTRGNYIPENAFVGGHSEVRNEPLYVGRAMHENCLLVGKVHTLYSACYLPYKGRELCVRDYEILIKPNYKYRGKLLRLRRQRNDVDRTRSAEAGREGRELAGGYQRRPMSQRDFVRRLVNGGLVGVQRVQAPEQPARGGQGVAPWIRAEAIVRAALEQRRQAVRWAANMLAQAPPRAMPFPPREAYVRAQVYGYRPFRNIQREQVAPERLQEVPAQAYPLRGQEGAQGNQERQEMAQNAEAEPQRNQEGALDAQLIPRELEAQRDQGIQPEGQGMPQDLRIQPEGQAARDALPSRDLRLQQQPDAQHELAYVQEVPRGVHDEAIEIARRIGIHAALPLGMYEGRMVMPQAVAQHWPVAHVEPRPVAGNQAEGMPPSPAHAAVPPAQAAAPPAAPRTYRDEFVAYVQRDWIPLSN